MVLLKFLNKTGLSPYQRTPWNLPTPDDLGGYLPGEWMPKVVVDSPICTSGYHFATSKGLSQWFTECLYIGEGRGKSIGSDLDNKVAYEEARLLYPVPAWHAADPAANARFLLRFWPTARGRVIYGKQLATLIELAIEQQQFNKATGRALRQKLKGYARMPQKHSSLYRLMIEGIWGGTPFWNLFDGVVYCYLMSEKTSRWGPCSKHRAQVAKEALEHLGLVNDGAIEQIA